MSDQLLTNEGAERALLGSVVRAGAELRVQMVAEIREEWFSSEVRMLVWREMRELINKSLPWNEQILEDSLRAHVPLETSARIAQELANLVPTADMWKTLVKTVHGYYIRRRGVQACLTAAQKFSDLKAPAEDALEAAESELFALHANTEGAGMRHISEALKEAYDSIQESISNRGYVVGGLPTGFTDIDRSYIKGMRPGQVIMICAPPGGGKTVMKMKMAWNRAAGCGDYDEHERALKLRMERGMHLNYQPCEVGVYTLEMPDVALAERLLITLSNIELARMQQGQIARGEKEKLAAADVAIKQSRLHMDYVPGISIQDLRVKARYAVMRHNLKLITIDYAQLITSSSKAAQSNRTQEMVDVSKGLKLLAQECNVPVIVCAQPKQETWGQRAGLNAMAETAQLAKDADLVIMLGFWDQLKGKNGFSNEEKSAVGGSAFDSDDEQEPDDPRVWAYADIVKNRHGPNTNGRPPIKLRWERDFFDFVSTNSKLYDPTGREMQK